MIPDENEYELLLDNLGISHNGNYSCITRANTNSDLVQNAIFVIVIQLYNIDEH